jgi:hypothetical protein
MSDDPKLNEWKLLRDQFDARVREDSDIEVIFDAEFRRRFTDRTAALTTTRRSQNVPSMARVAAGALGFLFSATPLMVRTYTASRASLKRCPQGRAYKWL